MNARTDLAQNREALMKTIRDAAIAEFAVNGLNGASTQAIANRAGISKTKLHYYISSKEDLYIDGLRHILEVWAGLFHDLDIGGEPEDVLRVYIRRKLRHAIDHPEISRMFASEVMRGAPLLRSLWEPSRIATHRAAGVIEDWIDRGLIRKVDPVLLQFNIWALTQHYALHLTEVRFMLELDDSAPVDLDHVVAEVTALILNGLKP